MVRIDLFVTLAAFASTAAAAELPAAPDASRYPQLAAMKRWLESGAQGAKHCALSGGLFAEASTVYRLNRSEPQTLDTMMKRHAETLNKADRERLRNTLTHVTGMAAGLADLDADSAPIAYAQLCIARMQHPRAVLGNEQIKGFYEAALRCQPAHAAGSLERKECVAAAFRVVPSP